VRPRFRSAACRRLRFDRIGGQRKTVQESLIRAWDHSWDHRARQDTQSQLLQHLVKLSCSNAASRQGLIQDIRTSGLMISGSCIAGVAGGLMWQQTDKPSCCLSIVRNSGLFKAMHQWQQQQAVCWLLVARVSCGIIAQQLRQRSTLQQQP
jgi:hypothetical protein